MHRGIRWARSELIYNSENLKKCMLHLKSNRGCTPITEREKKVQRKNWEIRIEIATLTIAFLMLLITCPRTSSWFKQTIPIQFGFLMNDKILQKIELSTGDPAKPIFLRFHNSERGTLTGVNLNIRFYRPLVLSGTKSAIDFIPGKTTYEGFTVISSTSSHSRGEKFFHGPSPDNAYYAIRYSELVMTGDEDIDIKVELNTKNIAPGTYRVGVITSSTQPIYDLNQADLFISMK